MQLAGVQTGFSRSRANSLPAKQRSASLKVDWTKVTKSLGLRGQTVASLQAFKKRNDDVRRKVGQLKEQPTTVDFAAYRETLKNKAIVDEIERRFNEFKPATYDVSRQLRAIDAFEIEAIKNAEATKDKVDLELQDLQKTLKNIEDARPFEDLTVVCRGGAVAAVAACILRVLTIFYRTRLPPPSRRSTRRRRTWFPRVVGMCRATKYAHS